MDCAFFESMKKSLECLDAGIKTLEKATELHGAAEARKSTGEKMAEAFIREHCGGLAFVPIRSDCGTYVICAASDTSLPTLRAYVAQLINHAIHQEREACLTCVREGTVGDNAGPYANGHRHAAEEIGQAIRARK